MSIENVKFVLWCMIAVLVIAIVWAWNRGELDVTVRKVEPRASYRIETDPYETYLRMQNAALNPQQPQWVVLLHGDPVGVYDGRYDMIAWYAPVEDSKRMRVLQIVRKLVRK